MGGAPASRSGSTRATVNLRAAQEALPSDCRWSAGTQLRELAPQPGQPRPRDLRTQPQKAEKKTDITFQQLPDPTPIQARAYELVRTFTVTGKKNLCYLSGHQQNTPSNLIELRF